MRNKDSNVKTLNETARRIFGLHGDNYYYDVDLVDYVPPSLYINLPILIVAPFIFWLSIKQTLLN